MYYDLINLPYEIKKKIQSYLYFSEETYKRLKPILFIIKNNNNTIWNYLYIHFYIRQELLNKLVFRYLIYNENIYLKLNNHIKIHFDHLHDIIQTEQIIKSLSYFELKHMYNYIMYD